MSDVTFLLLGGYGGVGQPLARLLLQETGVRLVLAGRTIQKAEALAAQLNAMFKGNRVTSRHVDASDAASLRQWCKEVSCVIVASSTARHAGEVARAALDAGVDYLDAQYSTRKNAVLTSFSKEIEERGRCFITDGGFHPGLPGVLVRYVAQRFDRMDKAIVGSVIRHDYSGLTIADSTVHEFLEEINEMEPLSFKEGRWRRARMYGMTDYITMDFGRKFGRQYCVPMFLEEMRSIPTMYPSLRETGFFVGGFNWFVDWFVFPSAAVALKIWPRGALKPMGELAKWGMKTFSRPPYGTLLKIEATGECQGRTKAVEMTLYHGDAYMFTAIPVAACLLQYLDGSARRPGLWTQAHIVEPCRLMKDMERMGIDIQIRDNSTAANRTAVT